MDAIKAWRKRKEQRLRKRGIRLDAGKNNNNNQEEEAGGGHGNTRLPYGIAKGRGLDTTGMTPREVWEMLIGEGVSPKEEYAKLGKKEEEPPPPPPKKTTITDERGREVRDLRVHSGWKGHYYLYGKREGWDMESYIDGADTKEDLLWSLKDAGLEEIVIDGETLNPKEMELPAYVYKDSGGKHYSKVAIGFRSGKFVATGTGMDGKSIKLKEASSLDGVLDWFDGKMDTKDLSVTKGAKKAEEERTGWLTSTGKEYYVSKSSGERVGHLSIAEDSWTTELRGETESGKKITRTFASKADAMYFLKSEGVEKVTVGKGRSAEKVDPTKETFDGEYYAIGSYSGMFFVKDVKMTYVPSGLSRFSGTYRLMGVGLDGSEIQIASDRYLDILRDYASSKKLPVTEDESVGKAAEIEAEARRKREEERIERERKAEEERKRREAERLERERIEREKREAFARKEKEALKDKSYHLISHDGHVYKNLEIVESKGWGGAKIYSLFGTDVDGERKTIREGVYDTDVLTDMLENSECEDYKFIDMSGKERARPTYGMRHISLEAKGKGFVVYADTKRFGKHEIMFEAPTKEECREWLEKNSVDSSRVKYRVPVPNDDAPRTHVANSLKKFDEVRRKQVEKTFISKMTPEEQQKATDMLTDLFAYGTYRMRRSPDSFEAIFDNGFKNLMETGTSGGSTSKHGRRGTEGRIFGLDDTTKAEDYSRYGFLCPEEDMGTADWYGSITYTFKKETVAERTTYTFGDSLDHSAEVAGYAGSKPTIEGCASGGRRLMDECLAAHEKFKRGEISYKELLTIVESDESDDYVELQFHGPLSYKDVSSIDFGSESTLKNAFRSMAEDKRKKVYGEIKRMGITIYCKGEDGFEVLKRLFPGIDK